MDDSELTNALNGVNGMFMLFCISLLPMAVLGIALFYSGLTQRRSAFTMLGVPFFLAPLVIIDWYIWGYSLCYASSSNSFIGSLNFAVLRHLKDHTNWKYISPRGIVSAVNHFFFNGLLKVICVALTFPGCVAERGRLMPMLVFLFFWSCIIYNPVTYWFWNHNGWLSPEKDIIPVLDFAGGNCIHVVSGFTTLAYSYLLGPRNPKILNNYRNSNSAWVLLGTFFLNIGWIGFIAGCDFKFSVNSIYIIVNTVLCSSVSGIIWAALDYYFSAIPLAEKSNANLSKSESSESTCNNNDNNNSNFETNRSPSGLKSKVLQLFMPKTLTATGAQIHAKKERRKLSLVSLSSGIITGLVTITPAGGYISSGTEFWKAIVFGVVGALSANMSTRLKYFMNVDDALDIFAIHGVAGIVGSVLTGIFATARYGSSGGWVEGNWKQIGYQILGSLVISAYVFVLSCFFLYIIDMIPNLHLRIDKEFNKIQREVKQNNSDLLKTADIRFSEKLELMGSDAYEFNGEFLMDFMEFIKVIQPDDFDEEKDFLEVYGQASGTCSGKLYEGYLERINRNQ